MKWYNISLKTTIQHPPSLSEGLTYLATHKLDINRVANSKMKFKLNKVCCCLSQAPIMPGKPTLRKNDAGPPNQQE